MDIISKRPNNGKFGDSSGKHSADGWSGTTTYAEALEQFKNGLPERAAELKKSLNAFKANVNIVTSKARPRNYYYGHAPNIPAAIIGLPKSMRHIEKIPQKVKAISIIYDLGAHAGVNADTLSKAGATVLQLVFALECRGYRVELVALPFNSKDDDRFTLAVILKEWRQSLDILKLSFPLCSPAMFRRFGFKWAEGVPGVKNKVFSYGQHLDKAQTLTQLKAIGYNDKTSYILNYNDCVNADFDPLAVGQALGIL